MTPPAAEPPDTIRRRLAYRSPYAWNELLAFHASHTTAGVEQVVDGCYRRTVEVSGVRGWLSIGPVPYADALDAELSASLLPVLPEVIARLRSLFDLDARPEVIAAHLSLDPALAPIVAKRPGLRLPGSFDEFELLVRTVLGQQISVKGATTLAGRLAAAFGDSVPTPVAGLDRAFPTAARLAEVTTHELKALGIVTARANAIRTVAVAVRDGVLKLGPSPDPEAVIAGMIELPGIGPWTAHYVAMRALAWPDGFPHGDLVVKRMLGDARPRDLLARAEAWRPWRGYATMHLWFASFDGLREI
jgi:AraC family transcriptional regulator of adaptative response / DNA-3-methyladenine glycosylase II